MYTFFVSSWTMEGSRRPPYVVHRRTKKVRICDSDSTTTGIDCTGAAAGSVKEREKNSYSRLQRTASVVNSLLTETS